nr:Hypothetical protein CBG04516 [Haemonchus contortus]
MLNETSKRLRFDLIALQEPKTKETAIKKTNDEHLFVLGAKVDGKNVGGVGFLVHRWIGHLIDSTEEFKQKTLPSAKYFDDHHLLHLIPGEKDDQTIYERTKDLVQKAMSSGVPILNNSPVNQPQFHACDAVTREDNRVAATKSSGEEEIRTSQKRSCSNRVQLDSRTEIEPNTDTMTDSLRSNFPVEESVLVTKSPYDSAEPFNATISEPAPKFPKSEADARRTSLDAANVSIKSVPVVLIIGAPGASRAEIAKRIVQKFYGFILLSMGDLLRSNIAAQVGDKLWRSVARQVERGEQVPLVFYSLVSQLYIFPEKIIFAAKSTVIRPCCSHTS